MLPAFDAIVDHAMGLFRAWGAAAFRSDREFIHLIAARGGPPGSAEYSERTRRGPLARRPSSHAVSGIER